MTHASNDLYLIIKKSYGMCKEIKRLLALSNCTHLTKTDRDALCWAIKRLSPEQAETETSFGGWNFESWPSTPDKTIFEELIKARKAKKKVIMTQAYIDDAANHLLELEKSGVSVNKALKVATIGGWQGFKASWIINEISKNNNQEVVNINSMSDVIPAIRSGSITKPSQIPRQYRELIENEIRGGRVKQGTLGVLSKIGFAV